MKKGDVEGLFFNEKWVFEIESSGNAEVTITLQIKNLSNNLIIPPYYRFRFREKEIPKKLLKITDPPKEIDLEGSAYLIPLNFQLNPFEDKEITFEAEFTNLAKRENDWWDVSLWLFRDNPIQLQVIILPPFECEDIKCRTDSPHKFDSDTKSLSIYPPSYTNQHHIKVAYKYKSKTELGKRNTTERSSISLSEKDIEQIRNRMPLLNYYSDKLSMEYKTKQFNDKILLVILHFLKDLIILLESLEKLGLDPNKCYLFWKQYLYPHKDQIILYLREKGYNNIYPLEELEDILRGLESENIDNLIILEDGGYIAPSLHYNFPNLLKKTIGVVEQTTKGIRRDKEISRIDIPIQNVAEAEIKMRIEPPYVADAIIQSVTDLLSHEKLRGRKIAVLGYGVIGTKIVERLQSMGCHVTVYDPESKKRIEARDKGLDVVSESYNAVKDKFLVIGCSGDTSINLKEILQLQHKAYLVSASSDQVEINVPELRNLSREIKPLKIDDKIIGTSYILREKDTEIRLIADGYPVNFWYSESMPNQVSDLILSILLLSVFDLVVNREMYSSGFYKVDEIVKKYGVGDFYEQFYK